MIEPLRHLDVFQPLVFGRKQIDVIGAGAVGSRVALAAARLGCENIHVWDFDTIEEHNIANQTYDLEQVGKFKVEALQDIIKRATGTKISPHVKKVDGTECCFGDIIFLLPDTMAARKEIWQGSIRHNFKTELMIEGRMGIDTGRVYAINPNIPSKISGWEKTLCSDEEAPLSPCGSPISVGATADILSGFIIWQFIRWFGIVYLDKKDCLEDELAFSTRSPSIIARNFEFEIV